jgi:hypothetical protein
MGGTAGVQFPADATDFSLLHSVHMAPGHTQPPIQWVLEALSPELRRVGREARYSPQSSAEFRNCGDIHPLPHAHSWRSAQSLYGNLPKIKIILKIIIVLIALGRIRVIKMLLSSFVSLSANYLDAPISDPGADCGCAICDLTSKQSPRILKQHYLLRR